MSSTVLIALLALLGVNLVVVAALVVAVLARRRCVSGQEGAFRGFARLLAGDVDGLRARPRRGYGRWVRDVLVWTPAPLFLRSTLAPVDRIESVQPVPEGQVRRLGGAPVRVALVSGSTARLELTVAAEDEARVRAPFTEREADHHVPPPSLAPHGPPS